MNVVHAPVERLDVPEAAFDAAVMFDTIEHLFDPRASLASAARALVPGGRLLVATPNFRALSRSLMGSAWAVLSPLEHMYYFEEEGQDNNYNINALSPALRPTPATARLPSVPIATCCCNR